MPLLTTTHRLDHARASGAVLYVIGIIWMRNLVNMEV